MSKPESVYIAGRFDRRDEFSQYRKILERLGVNVTSRWITEEPNMAGVPEHEQEAFRQKWAINDFFDVRAADTFLCFSEDLTSNLAPETHKMHETVYVPAVWARGGRHVEFGIAVAYQKRIVIIGPRENIFAWLPHVEVFKDVTAFVATFWE